MTLLQSPDIIKRNERFLGCSKNACLILQQEANSNSRKDVNIQSISRNVRFLLFCQGFSFGTFHFSLAGHSKNRVYTACCLTHELVSTGSAKQAIGTKSLLFEYIHSDWTSYLRIRDLYCLSFLGSPSMTSVLNCILEGPHN